MSTNAPKAAPAMITNSDKCINARGCPPAIMKPPITEPKTMSAPTMAIMGQLQRVVKSFRVLFQQEGLDGENRLRMNLADARLGHTERLGDLAQAEVFKIIKREDFALHLGQLLQARFNHAGQLL